MFKQYCENGKKMIRMKNKKMVIFLNEIFLQVKKTINTYKKLVLVEWYFLLRKLFLVASFFLYFEF